MMRSFKDSLLARSKAKAIKDLTEAPWAFSLANPLADLSPASVSLPLNPDLRPRDRCNSSSYSPKRATRAARLPPRRFSQTI